MTTLLDTAKTAEWFGLSVRTVERWRVEGKGPTFLKIGGRVMYDESDLKEFLAQARRTSTTDLGKAA